ncbi:MAG TPA: glycosyltransferase family 4 protein [Mycobacteriales bacterium]|nr:glycosyltransferase family 4 protein [Mycobacteriales bacterium]
MEILQIAGRYPPYLGGEEAVVETLATRQAGDHAVTVYTSTLGAAGVPRREAPRPGLRVVRLRALRIANTPVMPGLLVRLLRHAPRPDLLHVHTGVAFVPEVVAIAARLRGLRYVAHQHLMVRPSSRAGTVLLPLYHRLLYGPFLRRADRVVCLTAAMRTELVAAYDLDPARVVVIGNGVDTDRFRPGPEPRRPAELLFVGRLSAQKNVDALLEAAALLRARGRRFGVRIVGDGGEAARLERKAARLGLDEVVFAGRRGPGEVAGDYARATAVVMPSTHEGMPLVLLEAMASGAPVVTSGLPELAEVGADAVLAVDPLTAVTLADALDRVLRDPALRDRLSARAVVRARAYAWWTVVERIDKLYAEVLAS